MLRVCVVLVEISKLSMERTLGRIEAFLRE